AAAKATLLRALEVHTALCGTESEEVAGDYQALGLACQESEDLESAVQYYERALKLRERQLGGSTAEFAALSMGLAGAQAMRGQYGPVIELMQQAVGKFEGLRDERLAPALESLGTVFLLCGRTDDSIASLKRARKVLERNPDRNRELLEENARLFETVGSYL